VKISANTWVSKFWNIGIGCQSNIGAKIFENIGIDLKKYISIGLLSMHLLERLQDD